MIHDRGEWSIFPTWSVPRFHIVRGGKVIEVVEGWPRSPASSRRLLIDALHRAGLLREPSPEPTSLRSEEHTSELQSLMRISYAVFCLKKKKQQTQPQKL